MRIFKPFREILSELSAIRALLVSILESLDSTKLATMELKSKMSVICQTESEVCSGIESLKGAFLAFTRTQTTIREADAARVEEIREDNESKPTADDLRF